MTLKDLADACRLYALTRYDVPYERLRLFGPETDPTDREQRAELFRFLRAWRCRQFAKASEAMASDSLVNWSKTWLARLPESDVHLTDLSASQVARCADAYDALRHCRASMKRRNDRTFAVMYGPTGASKTLLAIRPNIFAPWDEAIREARGWKEGDAASFQVHLIDVARQLRRLSDEAGVRVPELPTSVGRPMSSPPKLIDEYNWATSR